MANEERNPAQKLFDFYLNSSIHVALAVTAFTWITMINLLPETDTHLLLFIFFSTVIGYNITKYTGSHQSGETPQPITRSILIFSLLCIPPLFYLILLQTWLVILLSGVMGLITISYSWPVFRQKSNLRDVSGLKIFVIAFVWATVSVLIPVLSSQTRWDLNIWVEFIQRFLFVIALTLPFDIRDIRFDTYQLGTIPQIIGIKKARIVGVILIFLVMICEFLKQQIIPDQTIILVLVCFFTALFVMKSVVKQTQYYASFWVESIPVIWCILLLCF